MAHFSVSAVGADRPGIVAAITGGLLDLSGNVEDSRMTILRGRFAVMLIVSLPEDGSLEQLDEQLAPVKEELGLDALTVSEIPEAQPVAPSPTHVITVYGADHPGIVHSISAEVAGRGVNITDLQTQLAGAGDNPLYVMMLEVELGDGDLQPLRDSLSAAAAQAEVEVSITEIETESF